MDLVSFHWCSVPGQKAMGTNGKTKASPEHQIFYFSFILFFFFYFESDQALAQIAQRCCGVSLLGDLVRNKHVFENILYV